MVKVTVPDEYDASVTLNEDGQLLCTDPSVIAPFVASEYVPTTAQVPSTPPIRRAKLFPLLMAYVALYAPDSKDTQYVPLGIDWPFAKTEQQPNRTAKIAIPRKNVFEVILNGICNVLFDKQKLREHNKRNRQSHLFGSGPKRNRKVTKKEEKKGSEPPSARFP